MVRVCNLFDNSKLFILTMKKSLINFSGLQQKHTIDFDDKCTINLPTITQITQIINIGMI